MRPTHTVDTLTLVTHDGPQQQADHDIMAEVLREYPWDLPPVRTAVDIGAHIGAWTVTAKMRWPRAEIVAVEVDPHNYSLLTLNAQHLPGVACLYARAGYDTMPYGLHRDPRNSGATRAVPLLPFEDTPPAPPPLTLEQIFWARGFVWVDVLKLDCEGAEVGLLRQATEDTLGRVHRIIGEIHQPPAAFEQATQGRLLQQGFRVDYRAHPGDPTLFYLHAWRDHV